MRHFGLGHVVGKLDASINTLSTGEKQRIKVIRCILHDKPIWVLDEGTSNLDVDCELIVLSRLREIQIQNRGTCNYETHNIDLESNLVLTL